MFGLFKKDPAKDLEKQIHKKQEEAMQAQRSGDIQGFAALTKEAEALQAKLSQMKS
jgi:hypothetical protein